MKMQDFETILPKQKYKKSHSPAHLLAARVGHSSPHHRQTPQKHCLPLKHDLSTFV